MSIDSRELETIISHLRQYIESNSFAGWDPYDAMNSPILNHLAMNTKYGRIFWTQIFRRSVINLRSFCMVPKDHNPKALGLFLSSYVKLYSIHKDNTYLKNISYLINKLKQLRSINYSGNCWGYNFDWQSKAAFLPGYTPTIVNTAFIGHALLDAYELLNNTEAFELAVPIKDFIIHDLNRKTEKNSFCFSYSPKDNNFVHNANMLGASFLIRLSTLINDNSLNELSHSSLKYSINHQHTDGSWYYAETDFQKWIDSFHTAFNLKALRFFLKYGNKNDYMTCYNKGINFYINNFFGENGIPKYYHDKTFPVDIHSPCSAIDFLSEETEYDNLLKEIINWTISNMWDTNKHYFYFRKHRHFTIKIPYMRWGQAWGLYGLTNYYFNKIHPSSIRMGIDIGQNHPVGS